MNAAAPVQKGDPLEALVDIVCGEFNEMPGMRLTRTQFRRLWHLSDVECDSVLRRLISSGFLAESDRGIGRPIDH
jgi:hypothetical protein